MEEKEVDVHKMMHEMVQTICGQRITIALLLMVGGILYFLRWLFIGLSHFMDGAVLSGCFSIVVCAFCVYICADSIRKMVEAVKLKKVEQAAYEKLVAENSCDSNIT